MARELSEIASDVRELRQNIRQRQVSEAMKLPPVQLGKLLAELFAFVDRARAPHLPGPSSVEILAKHMRASNNRRGVA